MPFRPANEQHAINEVVFTLNFARPFNGAEFERAAKSHDRWKVELPRATGWPPPQGFLLAAVPHNTLSVPTDLSTDITFDAVKRDGSIDWRMRLNSNWLAINCLTYTRWKDVWSRSRNLIRSMIDAIGNTDNELHAMSLQYIDTFNFEGSIEKYDIAELIQDERLLSFIHGTGPLWHCHLGWFSVEDLPKNGRRLLERIHLDATEQDNVKHVVRTDQLLRLDLGEPLREVRTLFEGEQPYIDEVFSCLHDRSKKLLGVFLSRAMSDRIQLNAPP